MELTKTQYRVNERMEKAKLLKMNHHVIATAEVMDIHVRDYYAQLGKAFNNLILRHTRRAKNGFRNQPLNVQLEEISQDSITPEIKRIAGLDNPNHPHLGVAKELAEDTFYRIMDEYSPNLNWGDRII